MTSAESFMQQPHDYGTKRAFLCLDDIRGKKVTVMGLGLHGGGEASVRFFLRHGAYVTVTDMKTAEELDKSIASLTNDTQLDTSRLQFVLGKHEIEDFQNADCVIKNPGVKYENNTYLAAAKCIETDLSIFLQFTKSTIIAITGSKGKSSAVSAIHYGLNKAGIKALLGGNITVSPLTFIDQTIPDNQDNAKANLPVVVLELSSWQLADLRGRKLLKPKIALITKIVPDHQNWYGNMETYIADKKLIYADQTSEDITICAVSTQIADTELPVATNCATAKKNSAEKKQAEQDWGDVFASESNARILRYPIDIPSSLRLRNDKNANWLDNLVVPGEHNKENILNAAFIMHLMGVEDTQTIGILKEYSGLAHRLEFFHTWKTEHTTYRIYNDSAATVPESAAAALSSFKCGIHLISGGTDKNLDFTPLVDALEHTNARHLLSFFLLAGTGTDKLIKMLYKRNETAHIPVTWQGPYDSLEALLKNLRNFLAQNTKVTEYAIVFSPGATSFGMFKNEFDRGNTFKVLAKKIFD